MELFLIWTGIRQRRMNRKNHSPSLHSNGEIYSTRIKPEYLGSVNVECRRDGEAKSNPMSWARVHFCGVPLPYKLQLQSMDWNNICSCTSCVEGLCKCRSAAAPLAPPIAHQPASPKRGFCLSLVIAKIFSMACREYTGTSVGFPGFIAPYSPHVGLV